MKLKTIQRGCSFLAILLLSALLTACGSNGGSDGGGSGTLSVALTDSAAEDYQAVYITVDRVQVHRSSQDNATSGWVTVAEPGTTYNLLDLVNGLFAQLGEGPLDSGSYGQLRLVLGNTADTSLNIFDQTHPYANYIIDMDGNAHKLKVPSGTQSGLKVINGFTINTDQTTDLLLDFDVTRSVVVAGTSGQYLLKPVIKILKETSYSNVYGTVSEANSNPLVPVPAAFVSAQTIAATAAPENQVVIEAGTLSTDSGDYALFLAPGTYDLVAAANGYQPVCQPVTLPQAGSTATVDLALQPVATATGSISGVVNIANPLTDADQHVTIAVRQSLNCGGTVTIVTVKTLQVANGGAYQVDLPAGSYQLVASTPNRTTLTVAVTVLSGADSGDTDFAF
ncbi:DUF4382 domain-containing protein [Pelobacter seleniigenes]|uniref:DUF4382 domain-containing protein n=1 Tax=Pelobacter seleniigenes TaxID=407188 RepID=UPI00068B7308|nr:DUF4382 domain-containing protein [Pelobacter seleniigenes]